MIWESDYPSQRTSGFLFLKIQYSRLTVLQNEFLILLGENILRQAKHFQFYLPCYYNLLSSTTDICLFTGTFFTHKFISFVSLSEDLLYGRHCPRCWAQNGDRDWPAPRLQGASTLRGESPECKADAWDHFNWTKFKEGKSQCRIIETWGFLLLFLKKILSSPARTEWTQHGITVFWLHSASTR